MTDKILLTRPQQDSEDLAVLLHGYETLIDPLFEIVFSVTSPETRAYDGLFATSRNALKALHRHAVFPHFAKIPLFVVGDETLSCAQELGFMNVEAANYSAHSLYELLISECKDDAALLYLAGKKRKSDLEQQLIAKGWLLNVWEGYDMKPSPRLLPMTINALMSCQISHVLLFSENAGRHFLSLAADLPLEKLKIPNYFCLSRAIADPLREKGLQVFSPDIPRLDDMLQLLRKTIRRCQKNFLNCV